MINRVEASLAGISVPVQWIERPEQIPSVTFEVSSEQGALYGDGLEKRTVWLVQVDIWSHSDTSALYAAVQAAMTAAGFRRYDAEDLYEEDTQIYHKAVRYSYTGP